jgi:hypothetical protein
MPAKPMSSIAQVEDSGIGDDASKAPVWEPSCDGGLLMSCVDTADVNTSLVGADGQFIGSPVIDGSSTPATFTTAFDAWDAANGDSWKLVNGGVLNLTINAYVGLNAGQFSAGLEPVIFTISGGE